MEVCNKHVVKSEHNSFNAGLIITTLQHIYPPVVAVYKARQLPIGREAIGSIASLDLC